MWAWENFVREADFVVGGSGQEMVGGQQMIWIGMLPERCAKLLPFATGNNLEEPHEATCNGDETEEMA